MKKSLPLILSAIFLASCDNADLPEYAALDTLRVLALVNDTGGKSEVDPGATVTVTPWVSDINNTGPLTTTIEHCVDLGVSAGAEPTCAGNPTRVTGGGGTISTLNAGNTYTAAADTFSVTVPSSILDNRSAKDRYNGVAYLVIYAVTNAQGKTVTAFKRIMVSDPSKTAKNSNPAVTAILAGGASFTALAAGGDHSLSASFPAGSKESYDFMKDDGSTGSETEILQSTWFYTDGEMKYERTTDDGVNTYEAPDAYPGTRSSILVVVTRDGRGGTAVTKATAN